MNVYKIAATVKLHVYHGSKMTPTFFPPRTWKIPHKRNTNEESPSCQILFVTSSPIQIACNEKFFDWHR